MRPPCAGVGAIVLACVLTLVGQGCGGNSSGSNSEAEATPTLRATATPRLTVTPRRTGSASPSATRTPTTPPGQQGTPTPTPTEVPPTDTPTPETVVITVTSGQSIAAAARKAPDGAIVVVAPGIYGPVILQPDDLEGSLTLFADVTGEFTDSAAAPVIIAAGNGDEAAFEGLSQSELAIDGFTLRGGTRFGFLCRDCAAVSVLDCTVTGGGGDAVRLEFSDSMLIFNNLLYGNKGAGVTAVDTTNLEVINNTIYNHKSAGILLSRGSTDAFVVNNILQQNIPTGIFVDPTEPSSLDGFFGDFNLNTNGYFGTTAGRHDIAVDPLFVFPTGGDFHLAGGSQAIDSGTDAIDPDLLSSLEVLSTQTDGSADTSFPDLGYHYIPPTPTPTRPQRPTRTPTPRPTSTRTP